MNKSKFIMVVLALHACTVLLAQSSRKTEKATMRHTTLGFKAGVNIANQTIETEGISLSPGSITGWTAGWYLNLPFGTGGFSLQPEVLYSVVGSDLNLSAFDPSLSSVKQELGYVAIPILPKYTFPNNGFGIYAGPQIGILVSAKQKGNGISVDAKDEYNSTDVSGVFGVDYTLEMGLNFAARYQLGFGNIAKGAASGESLRNNAFSFTIGYNIIK